VLEQLCPSHDTWSGIWRDEAFALRAVGICTDLLAHFFADAGKLGLELHAMLQVYFRFCVRACLLRSRSFLCNCRENGLLRLLDEASLRVPALELILAPIDQVVHVLEQLRPSHDAWGGVWRGEALALRALGIRTNLLAHLLTDASELGLDLHAIAHIGCHASLLRSLSLLSNR